MTPPAAHRDSLVQALLDERDPRALRRLASGSPLLADEAGARAVQEGVFQRFFTLLQRDRADAQRAARVASTLAGISGSPWMQATALRLAAASDFHEGRTQRARRHLERAAELFGETGDRLAAADAYRALVHVVIHGGDYDAAREAARRAKRLYARCGADPGRLARLEVNLGNLHHRLDEHERALAAYGRARRLFAKAGDGEWLASVAFNEANILATLDRTSEARALYETALAGFEQAGSAARVALAGYAIAGLDLLEDALDRALERLAEVRAQQSALGEREGLAHTDLELAQARLRLNQAAQAEADARRALSYFKAAQHDAEQARALATIAGAQLQKRQPSLALRSIAQGRAHFERAGNAVGAAELDLGAAQARLALRDAAGAAVLARGAARLFARRGLLSKEARAWAIAAEAERAAGRAVAARKIAVKSLACARRGRDLRAQVAARLVLARLDEARGRRTEAFRQLRGAEACVDRLRRGVTTDESKIAFALDKTEVYEALVLNRLQRQDARSLRQALLYAERGKARVLADRLRLDPRTRRQGGDETRALLARLEELERRLALAEARLAASDEGDSPGVRAALPARIARERFALLGEIARRTPEAAALAGLPPRAPLGALDTLDASEVAVVYTAAAGWYHAFVAERGRIVAFPRLAAVASVADEAERLRFLLGKGVLGAAHSGSYKATIARSLARVLERLHELLVEPFAARLPGRQVVVVPHGDLHGLPFHAFGRGGRALLDDATISYAPSLATWGALRERARSLASGRPVVLGAADRLAPEIAREVSSICARLGDVDLYDGERAGPEALHAAALGPPLLHVASHGFFAEGDRLQGALKLGEHWVPLRDLYALPGTAEMVVLSGCETARGSVHAGDEWIGLVRGFLEAGARTVVGALWEVHDRTAALVMDAFYEELTRGCPAALALTRAQRRARALDPCALVWAPFALTGDARHTLRPPVA